MAEVTRLVTIIDACDDGKNLCDDGTCSSQDCAERDSLLYGDQEPPDTEPPAVTLRGDDHLRVTYGNPVEGLSLAPCAFAAEPANATCYAHAVDSQDGDVSAALTLAQAEGESPLCAWKQALGATCYPGSYTYVYQVEDAAGNAAAAQVIVELVEAQVVATEVRLASSAGDLAAAQAEAESLRNASAGENLAFREAIVGVLNGGTNNSAAGGGALPSSADDVNVTAVAVVSEGDGFAFLVGFTVDALVVGSEGARRHRRRALGLGGISKREVAAGEVDNSVAAGGGPSRHPLHIQHGPRGHRRGLAQDGGEEEKSEVESLAAEFGVLLEESASSGEDGSPAALGGYLEAAAAAQDVTLASDVEGLSQNVTTAALSGEVDGVAAMHASLVAELEGVLASLADTTGTADDVERLVEESEEGPADGQNTRQARVQATWSSGFASEAANIEAFSTSLEQARENADKALEALADMELDLQESENSGAAEVQRNINELEASLLDPKNETLLPLDIAPPPPQGEPDCSNIIQDRLEFHFTLGSSQLPSTPPPPPPLPPPPPPPLPTPSPLPSPPSLRRLLARGKSSTSVTAASDSSTEAGDDTSEGDSLMAYQSEFNTTLTDQRTVAIKNHLLKGISLTTTRRSTKRCTERFPQLADWNGACYAGPLDAEVYGSDPVYNTYSDLYDPGLLGEEKAYYNLTRQST
eukprot:gene4008-4976_t